MKKFFVFMVFAVVVFPAWPKNVHHADARKAAIAWMKRVPEFTKANYQPRSGIHSIKNMRGDTTLVYALELQPKGYILVVPEEDLYPILGFSSEAPLDTTESEENHLLLLIRLDMPERLQAVREGKIAPGYKNRANALWRELLQDSGHSLQKQPVQINWVVEKGPFLTCRWSQGNDAHGNYVFNYYTPNHYVCGCVATAFSQILYYWRWPVTGTDDYSYLWGGTPLSANFGATTYDWANMVDYYGSPAQPEIKRQAVGLLTYHTGVSVDMDYGPSGSGAVTAKVGPACKNFFRCNGEWVSSAVTTFWDQLYNNMLLDLPAELSIRTESNVGHAIVTDGVRHEASGPKYYHLNFGWGGYSDGWYDISGDFTAGGYTWRYKDGAVMYIIPLADLYDPGTLLNNPTYVVSWNDGPVFTPTKYELQQAYINSTLTNFSDNAESGLTNWIADTNWKDVTIAYHSPSHAFKGYISESTQDVRTFSSFDLNKAVKIDATTQISYYWTAYYFDNCEARFEISTDEKNWVPLRTHTSTNKSWPLTWTAVTISPAELSAYVGSTALCRFIVRLTASNWYYGTSVGFYFDDLTIQNIYLGSWTIVDDNINDTSKEVTVSQSGDYLYRVRPYWNGQWWGWSDVEAVQVELPATVALQVRALLEGPYLSAGAMSTTLRNQGLIPNNSPYSQAPAYANPIPANVCDWLLLQLYESDGATVAQSRSVFVRNDGYLVDENGNTPFNISGVYKSKNYYIVLKHRNHIRVMSANTVSFASGSASYDFTDNINKYYGSNGAKSLPVGYWGLWSGDVNQDGVVDGNDFSAWRTAARNGDSGYSTYDMRLDGRVTSADYVYWYNNDRLGASTGMPNP